MKPLLYVVLGAGFGFLLSMAGATDYDRIAGMFRFTDLHLMGVMGSAIAVAALGFAVLRRRPGPALNGDPVELKPKPMRPWIFAAGLVFGLGWALTGSWPGTVLAQVGEGKTYAWVTLAGLIGGTTLYGLKAG